MNLKYNTGIIFVVVLLLCSCTKEPMSGNDKLTDGIPTDIGVKTKTTATDDESSVTKIYLTTHFTSISRAGQVDVRRESDVSGSTVVMQVNSGVRDVLSVVNPAQRIIDQLNAATDKNAVMGLTHELGETLPVPPFVMSAQAESQNLQQTGETPMDLPLSLTRLVARLDLTIEFDVLSDNFKPGGKYEGWTITLQTVKIGHMPTVTPLFPRSMTYDTYKETSPIAMNVTPNVEKPDSWIAANKFYITENIFSDKQNPDKSTWVEFRCIAKPPVGYNETELALTYRIAIGNHQTAHRDFTINRNGLYTLKVKLVGLDPAERVFIHSEVAPWSDMEVNEDEMMGYPGDIQLINYQFEAIVAVWTEDARDIDKIGLPWGGSDSGGGEGDANINGDPWHPDTPPGGSIGEGWN